MMKMRLFCCHPLLVTSKSKFFSFENFYKHFCAFLKYGQTRKKKIDVDFSEEEFVSRLKQKCKDSDRNQSDIKALETFVRIINRKAFFCQVCRQKAVNPVLMMCLHVYCDECFRSFWLSEQKVQLGVTGEEENKKKKKTKRKRKYVICKNELCNQNIYFRQQLEFPRINRFDTELSLIQPNEKIEKLIESIVDLRGEKSIVFSQFLGMIDIIQEMFKRFDISYIIMTGSDKDKQRTAKIRQFEKGPEQVFLISLKCGYAGLNLQMANNMFFMDPWWNPAIEDQALGRIHRIGQTKNVEAVSFITEGTLEESIKVMNQEKRLMYDFILDSDCRNKRKKKMERIKWLQAELIRNLERDVE